MAVVFLGGQGAPPAIVNATFVPAPVVQTAPPAQAPSTPPATVPSNAVTYQSAPVTYQGATVTYGS